MSYFPEEKRGVYDDHVFAGRDLVAKCRAAADATGAARMLDEWDAKDKRSRSKFQRGGRKPWLTTEQVILLRLICAQYGTFEYQSVAALIGWGMSKKMMAELGIVMPRKITPDKLYKRVWTSIKHAESVIDPYDDYSIYRRRTYAEFDAYMENVDPAFVQERMERSLLFLNAFTQAIWKVMPPWLRGRCDGHVAVDATFVQAPARPGWGKDRAPERFASSDPHAAVYARQGDHGMTAENEASVGKKLTKVGWGYEATFVVSVANDPTREATFPSLIVGASFDRPGREPALNALAGIRAARRAGIPVKTVTGDRAYGNHPKVSKWALPLRKLGIDQVFDMRFRDLGRYAIVDGAMLLEGNLYCPCMAHRDDLIFATLDYRFGRQVVAQTGPQKAKTVHRRITWTEWQKLIKERAKFLLTPHGRVGKDGKARYRCPAMGPNPTVNCPLRKNPDSSDAQLPLGKKMLPLTVNRGGYCNNKSGISTAKPHPQNAVNPNDPNWKPADDDQIIAREVQHLQFGSDEWIARFSVGRQTIESVNDRVKHRTALRFDNTQGRRARGYSATVWYTALAVLTYNMKHLARFLTNITPVDRDGRGPVKKNGPRRREQHNGYDTPRGVPNTQPVDPDGIPPDGYEQPDAA